MPQDEEEAGEEGEKVSEKTVGVKYESIEYPCGCVSRLDRMEYCKVHSGEESRRLRDALQRIKDRTITDAEGPELRCQNENNYKDALEALGGK